MRVCARAVLGAALASGLLVAAMPSTATAVCSNDAYRTGPSAKLADCRAYEQVSPVDKRGGFVNFPIYHTSLYENNRRAMRAASPDGRRVLFSSMTPFTESLSGSLNSFIAQRSDHGWFTRPVTPATPLGHVPSNGYPVLVEGASDDFSRLILGSGENLDPRDIDGGMHERHTDVYARQVATDLQVTDAEWISRPWDGAQSGVQAHATYTGGSDDGRHILFLTSEQLTPAASALAGTGVSGDPRALYDRVDGQTILVSVDDDGAPMGACGAILGSYRPGNAYVDVSAPVLSLPVGAVSSDGSRIVFSTPDPLKKDGGYPDPSCAEPSQLYMRIDGDRTVHLSASQRDVPDPDGTADATFAGAAADGSAVLFNSPESLTNDAPVAGLGDYLYLYTVATGQLDLVASQATTLGVTGDLSKVFYVARSTNEIRVRANDGDRVIAAVDALGSDGAYLMGPVRARQVSMSVDGRYLAFAVSANLTPFASGTGLKVYLWDDRERQLHCASCAGGAEPVASPHAALSVTAAQIGVNAEDVEAAQRTSRRNVVADGTVFFETADRLVSSDTNGSYDVYAWRRGELSLISGGRGPDGSFFYDASADGRDAFFTTTDSLSPTDVDNGDRDVYDARAGGGFPTPAAPPRCTGDDCQGSASPDPEARRPRTDGIGTIAPAAPAATFSLSGVTLRTKRALIARGTGRVMVRVNRAGRVTLRGRARVRGHVRIVARGTARSGGAGPISVPFRLSSSARAQLRRTSRLRLQISVRFADAAGPKTLTLDLRRTR